MMGSGTGEASVTRDKQKSPGSGGGGTETATPAPAAPALVQGGPGSVADVLALQRAVGNQQTAAMLAPTPTETADVPAPAPTETARPIAGDISSGGDGTLQRQVATAATVEDAIAEIVDTWDLVGVWLDALGRHAAKIFDEAEAAADKKRLKKLAKSRNAFEANLGSAKSEHSAAYLEAALCQGELNVGHAEAAGQIPALRGKLQQSLTELLRGLMDAAKLAHTHGEPGRAAIFTGMAEDAQTAGGALANGGGDAKAATDHKGNLATANTVGDTLNNTGPGVAGGIVGGVEAASGATIFGSVAGGIFAGLGIVFGSIGLALGIKAYVRGKSSEAELKELEPTLDSDELGEATAYAAEKKRKKKWGGAASAMAGGMAVTAGVVGLIALSVATLGIGAAILGIGAAVVGLSFLIGKYIHKKLKRAKYAKMLARSLVDAAKDDADADAQAQAMADLTQRGFDVQTLGTKAEAAETTKLVGVFEQEGRNRREDMAGVIYAALVGNDVSEQIDAERIVEALHLDPTELRSLEESAAKSKITGKMSSW